MECPQCDHQQMQFSDINEKVIVFNKLYTLALHLIKLSIYGGHIDLINNDFPSILLQPLDVTRGCHPLIANYLALE